MLDLGKVITTGVIGIKPAQVITVFGNKRLRI